MLFGANHAKLIQVALVRVLSVDPVQFAAVAVRAMDRLNDALHVAVPFYCAWLFGAALRAITCALNGDYASQFRAVHVVREVLALRAKPRSAQIFFHVAESIA